MEPSWDDKKRPFYLLPIPGQNSPGLRGMGVSVSSKVSKKQVNFKDFLCKSKLWKDSLSVQFFFLASLFSMAGIDKLLLKFVGEKPG